MNKKMRKIKLSEKPKKNKINKKSIKVKITLWYTALILGIVVVFLGVLFYIGSFLVKSSVQNRLKQSVQATFKRIEISNNEIKIDSYLDNFANEIFLSLYDKNKEFLYGDSYFDFDMENIESISSSSNQSDQPEGKVREIVRGGFSSGEPLTRWYIYEEKINMEGYGDIWVRGITPATRLEKNIETLTYMSLVVFPLLILVSIFGGYWITKKSFEPIEKITDTVEQINAGNDLSRRINIQNNKDEISILANTFDSMFDRLQESFNREIQFTSDVSHELRTPIAVINSQAQYGLKYVDINDETKEILTSIKEESDKMKKMVGNLLTLARMDKGSQKLNIENVNIYEILEVAVETQRTSADEKNIEIVIDSEEEVFGTVDEEMIRRVFINLISNSISYGRQNGNITIKLDSVTKATETKIAEETESDLLETDNKIICEIKDNGIGISKEHINKIWDRFYQVDNSRVGDNSGLGLSMVKGIIEAHKGIITVESELGVGTVFTFELPVELPVS